METTREITGSSTMEEVLEAYPSAQRALFQKHHIGGCSSCGFEQSDTLEVVLKKHRVTDVAGTIAYLKESAEVDKNLQINVKDASDMLKNGANARLVDVRHEFEWDMARIEGAALLSQELMQEIMTTWDKTQPIIFYCHHGMRSLEAASYFAGHGFKQAKSMQGGIDAWAAEIDTKVPRY